MHLLFLNDMKYLFEKWLLRKNNCRLKPKSRRYLQELMLSLTPYVPSEFQRNIFDTSQMSQWKATQYSFMLLYIDGIVLKFVLPKNIYRHFLHLHVASRILCSSKLAMKYTDYANNLLRTFCQCRLIMELIHR